MTLPGLAIVNPVAAGGRAGARWQRLGPLVADRLPGLVVHATRGPGDAEVASREWATEHQTGAVVVAGGDGSVHEVVNGLLSAGWRGCLGVIPSGTGNDFARSAGLPLTDTDAAGRIGGTSVGRVDLGLLRFVSRSGAARERRFLNAVSVGVSPRANRMAHSLKPFLPGRIAYTICGVLALLREGSGVYGVTQDGASVLSGPALNITFANGASFGGGMRISPASRLDDGVLDQVTIGAIGRLRALLALSRLYQGSHVTMPGVTVRPVRGTARINRAGGSMWLEADGHDFEAVGELAVDVEPAALRLFR